jgi:tRNA(Ile)-lysidine synthase
MGEAALADLVQRVRGRVRSLEEYGRGVVAAVSGGADSVALLHALIAARDPSFPFPVILAHLNHKLRGAESDADEAFTADLYGRLVAAGVPAFTLNLGRIDVAAQARAEGDNLEATARRVRYRWLAEVAREAGARWVATGHTADDQAETVMHRLLRGTGLQGLRGIAAWRELETGVGVMRPLLQTTRAEIVAYLRQLNQPYREDSTNRDLAYTRNRIRLELLPYLAERYNPAVAMALARLAEQVEEVFRDEQTAAVSLLSAAELPRAGTMLVFDRARLAAAPPRLTRAALRFAWTREAWPLDAMGYDAWDRLAGLAHGESGGLDLPGFIHAHLRGQVLQIGPKTFNGDDKDNVK